MLYAYGPPSAQDAWALPPVTPEEGQPSFAAMLAEIARIVAEGHLWLVSGASPREGDRLENAARNAPDRKPPRGLLRAVGQWLRSVGRWRGRHTPMRRPTSEIDPGFAHLESRNNVLFDEVRRGLAHAREERRELSRSLHKRMDTLQDTFQAGLDSLREDLSLTEQAIEHERGHIVENAMARWCLNRQTWGNLLALDPDRIATELLWNDQHAPRHWAGTADFLGLPRDSLLQRCDHLSRVALDFPDGKTIQFLIVGEASVTMDSGRIAKALQHVQAIQDHTAYPVLPCVCARDFSNALLERALRAGMVPLEWVRGGSTRCRVNEAELEARTRAMES